MQQIVSGRVPVKNVLKVPILDFRIRVSGKAKMVQLLLWYLLVREHQFERKAASI